MLRARWRERGRRAGRRGLVTRSVTRARVWERLSCHGERAREALGTWGAVPGERSGDRCEGAGAGQCRGGRAGRSRGDAGAPEVWKAQVGRGGVHPCAVPWVGGVGAPGPADSAGRLSGRRSRDRGGGVRGLLRVSEMELSRKGAISRENSLRSCSSPFPGTWYLGSLRPLTHGLLEWREPFPLASRRGVLSEHRY